jgi:predicted DNA-binding transcriptional regulator AlpA
MKTFPQPFKIADGTTRWKLSAILAFEAERTGTRAPNIEPQCDLYLSARAVAARLGVAPSTVWRWAAESARAARSEAA